MTYQKFIAGQWVDVLTSAEVNAQHHHEQEVLHFVPPRVDPPIDLSTGRAITRTWKNPGRPYCEMDTEADWLFWMIKFYLPDGRMYSYSICAESPAPLDVAAIQWFIDNFTLITFNGINYDRQMVQAALCGANVHQLKGINDHIIKGGLKWWRFADEYPQYSHAPAMANWDEIDIMEVAPGVRVGLKTYMGRMHAPKLQDLPFDPDNPMPFEMRAVTDEYCGNDLQGTRLLRETVQERIDLRVATGERYGVDLRSKSDAQMAEAIIKASLPFKPIKPFVRHGHTFRYTPPAFIKFRSSTMQAALAIVLDAQFVVYDVDQLRSGDDQEEFVDAQGKKIKTGVKMPAELKKLKIIYGSSAYQFGIGGLHSTEKGIAHYTIPGKHTISDHDVVSYYPSLILLLAMYPEQLGPVFLEIYKDIYEKRLLAKKRIPELKSNLANLRKELADLDGKTSQG